MPTTSESNTPFHAHNRTAHLSWKQAGATHPSLGHPLAAKATILGYDDLHHHASEPTRLAEFDVGFADANPEGQRHWKATSGESISASPAPMGVNGVASYAYDQVSNRISRTPSIAGVVNQSLAFNDNDQIDGGGYAYDDNGSTTQAPDGSADVYSFDNMLIRRVNTAQGLTVDMVYSATGDRVSKTTNGVTTNYLVDTNNHTGYAQVLEETDGAGNLEAVMVYGHDLISQDRSDGVEGFEMSFYSYDGLGSVRGLTDSIGTSLGKVHYDAYGTEIENTLSVNNPYLFAGERFDNDLGLYYLRARYLDVETGRFWSLDDFEGNNEDVQTLHKYLYAGANPVNNIDPSGNVAMLALTGGIGLTLEMEGLERGYDAAQIQTANRILTVATIAFTAAAIAVAAPVALDALWEEAEPRSVLDVEKVIAKLRRRNRGMHFFAHGTSTGVWEGGFSNVIESFGRGDFGPGFYTWRLPEGLHDAISWAQGTANGEGGIAMLLVYGIPEYKWRGLRKKYLEPGTWKARQHFSYHVIYGPLSGNVSVNFQWKFQNGGAAALTLLAPIPIPFGPGE